LGLLVLTACTPAQMAWWSSFAGPVEGADVACAEWVGTSRVAGFSDDELPIVQTLMWRESRCDPGAHNASGASGLMQVMPMWADDCGGTPAQLLEPQFNLTCARHVFEVQGWQAWSTYP
jgi:hypothetical protein